MWRCLLLFAFSLHAEVSALYLTWYDDPTTTMTIQWHTPDDEVGDAIFVWKNDEWEPVTGSHLLLDSLIVHKVSLERLSPNTEYQFKIGEESTIHRFKTAPASLDTPLRFIIGGDVFGNTKIFRKMCETALAKEPLFCALGGDIAYAIGLYPFRSSALKRWSSFFKEWQEGMTTKEGRLIPFLIAPGNHDLSPDHYELFFSLFAFPQKQLYRAVDFGNYLTLFLLDTGHFQPVEGRQTLWLEKALASRASIPYRFAIYHEAAYPSYYPYNGTIPKKIRTHWVPLFEKHRLSAAFENHNHTYKRTHPIKQNEIREDGVIYFGDGSWGVAPRGPHDLWYLAKKEKKNALLLVELSQEKGSIEAFDLFNNLLDSAQVNK